MNLTFTTNFYNKINRTSKTNPLDNKTKTGNLEKN